MARTGRKTLLGVFAALLAVAGAVTLVLGLASPQATPAPAAELSALPSSSASSSLPSSATSKPTARTPRPSASTSPRTARAKPTPTPRPAAKRTPRLTESVPTRVRIPAAEVDASTVKLGIADDGTMETPEDPDQVGWFDGARTPGGPGVAVLAGHVTWNGRETVFFDLGRLDRGTKVALDREDGTTATFAITRRSTFPKDEFPTREVYRATSTPELVLITCGGEYDADRRYYDANIIVWAELLSIRPS